MDLKSIELETKRENKMTTVGKVLLGVTGGVFTGIGAVTLPFVSPALRKVSNSLLINIIIGKSSVCVSHYLR